MSGLFSLIMSLHCVLDISFLLCLVMNIFLSMYFSIDPPNSERCSGYTLSSAPIFSSSSPISPAVPWGSSSIAMSAFSGSCFIIPSTMTSLTRFWFIEEHFQTLYPAALNIESTMCVVLVFPTLPVIPIMSILIMLFKSLLKSLFVIICIFDFLISFAAYEFSGSVGALYTCVYLFILGVRFPKSSVTPSFSMVFRFFWKSSWKSSNFLGSVIVTLCPR